MDRGCQYCKTVIRIARSITLSKNAFKKYLFIKTNSCCSKLLSISEILVLNPPIISEISYILE